MTPDGRDPQPAGEPLEAATGAALRQRFLSYRTLLGFAIGVALLVITWILTGLTFEELLDRITNANPWLILAAYGIFALTFPIRTLRWRLLLENAAHREDVNPHYRNSWLLQILFISWFVNGITPLKLGDLYRAYMARANFATSLTRTLGTVFSERVFDVATLIALVLASATFVVRSTSVSEDVGRIVMIAAIALALLAVALALMLAFGQPIFRAFPERARGIYDRFHSGIFDSWTWRSGPLLWLFSLLIWSAELTRLALVTRALGVELGIAEIIFTGTAASLLLAVPTPGGLGAVEGGMVGLLRLIGVGAAPAGAIAIVDRIISYWSLNLVGVLVFSATRLKK